LTDVAVVGSVERSTADGEYEIAKASGQNETHIKFGLSGCHDTTLAGMLASVGALQDWPRFSSHIAVEMFRRKDMPAVQGPASAESRAEVPASVPAKRTWWGGVLTPATSPVAPGMPPPGIGRKRTEELSATEKAKLDGYVSGLFVSSALCENSTRTLRELHGDMLADVMLARGCAVCEAAIQRRANHDSRLSSSGQSSRGERELLVSVFLFSPDQTSRPDAVCHSFSSSLRHVLTVYTHTHSTLSAFKAIVDRFTPYDWHGQCNSNKGQPASPTGQPEPAGF
jgi:hypothetical protein